jgi:septal ring factor EnvC (AmiA/AmiB activator)
MADLAQPLILQIDGIKDIRRLSAALEQYNAKAGGWGFDADRLREEIEQRQIYPTTKDHKPGKLEAAAHDLIKAHRDVCADYKLTLGRETEMRAEIAKMTPEVEHHRKRRRDYENAAVANSRAVHILRGEPVGPRDPSQPISLLESAAVEASNLIEALREALKAERVTIAARDKEIDALRSERGLMQHSIDTWRGRCNDLQQKIDAAAPREPEVKLIAALKERLAAANATICELARDNTELREEVAVAEAFAAKTKPFIEAARAGHVYAAFGQWVIPEEGEGKRAGKYREIRVSYSVEDLKCLS